MPIPSHVHDEIVDWMRKPAYQDHFRLMTITTRDAHGWCQVSFEGHHKDVHHIDDLENIHMSEQPVYTDENLRAATWVIAPVTAQKQKGVIIELEVESRMQGLEQFLKTVTMDQVKVSRCLQPEYGGYDVGVYAIAYNPVTQATLEANGMQEVREARIDL
jgi:hypothetical protein